LSYGRIKQIVFKRTLIIIYSIQLVKTCVLT